jgi:hypothetical protein
MYASLRPALAAGKLSNRSPAAVFVAIVVVVLASGLSFWLNRRRR